MGCHQFSKGAVTQLQNNGYCSAICFVQKTGSKIFNDARMSQLSLKKVNQDSETILFNFIIKKKKILTYGQYFVKSLVACAYNSLLGMSRFFIQPSS